MKERIFYFGCNNYTRWHDGSMTSKRAYVLMRAWRRNSKQPSNSPKWIFKKIGIHEYAVKIPGYPDTHLIKWSLTK